MAASQSLSVGPMTMREVASSSSKKRASRAVRACALNRLDLWEQVQVAHSAWERDEVPRAEPARPQLLEALAAPEPPASDLVIRRAATEVLGWLAWLLSFAVLVVTGYVTFQSGYVGKWPEFIPIFLWAFGLDVGVNTMLAKGLKKG